MSDTTTTFLSDAYIRCQKCYIEMAQLLLYPNPEEFREIIQDRLNDVMFYLNSILENSTPEYWSDEEYAWIEGLCEEFRGVSEQ